MYSFGTLFLISALIIQQTELIRGPEEEVTVGIKERLSLLKFQIAQEIKNKEHHHDKKYNFVPPINDKDIVGNVEYEVNSVESITPIPGINNEKKRQRILLRRVKTTSTPKEIIRSEPEPLRVSHNVKLVDIDKKNDETKKSQTKNLKNLQNLKGRTPFKTIFYRRNLESMSRRETDWLHCQDLITPYILGHKTNMTERKRIPYDDYLVIRLMQLFNEATYELGKEDIYSIMFQISKLQLKLFQWDVQAIKLLLQAVTQISAKSYTFKTIVHGIKKLFATWHLDLGNKTHLLQQARLFRPPCVTVTPYEGSTKSPKSTSYTKYKEPKEKVICRSEDDQDCLYD